METQASAESVRRCIGLDVHREFAQVAIWQGGLVAQAGRFATTPQGVRAFAEGLGPADEVALEATGNTWAIATLLASRAGRVVVSNPAKTRAIAEAKVKTDLLTELPDRSFERWRGVPLCWLGSVLVISDGDVPREFSGLVVPQHGSLQFPRQLLRVSPPSIVPGARCGPGRSSSGLWPCGGSTWTAPARRRSWHGRRNGHR